MSLRMWCLGDVVNLCTHALIFGKGKGERHEAFARAERKGYEDGRDKTSAPRNLTVVAALTLLRGWIKRTKSVFPRSKVVPL